MSAQDALPPLDGIAGWAVQLMDTLGGLGAAITVGLDNLFPPIPSELVLPLAGFAASQGVFSYLAALIWTTVGSVAGAVIVYFLGVWLGRDRTRSLIARIPLVKGSDFDRTERWFAKHGTKAVLFGRMVPVFRSLISLPAGIERMRLPTFVALTTVGSLAWNAIFVSAGFALGANWRLVQDYAGIFQKGVLVLVLAAIAAFVVTRLRGRRSRRAAEPAEDTGRGERAEPVSSD